LNNNYNPTYLPNLSHWGTGGEGGGCGSSNGTYTDTAGKNGTPGFIRIYWLRDNYE
jgi:hypothetical protein